MRELHAVTSVFDASEVHLLKHKALLFDKIYLTELLGDGKKVEQFSPETRAEIDFLRQIGLVDGRFSQVGNDDAASLLLRGSEEFRDRRASVNNHERRAVRDIRASLQDGQIRAWLKWMQRDEAADLVPIYWASPPALADALIHQEGNKSDQTVLQVALAQFPVPSTTCSWEQILDFKSEMHDKNWAFRRWLHSLSTKQLTAAEIRDEFEWMLNEYRKAMEIYHAKASTSFVDVFVIAPLEILENLLKLNLSKIAKGILQVRKRRIELEEAEMKASGRECAYVFDARQRFGRSPQSS
jgi:hypothetical protein